MPGTSADQFAEVSGQTAKRLTEACQAATVVGINSTKQRLSLTNRRCQFLVDGRTIRRKYCSRSRAD